jgi:RHS repeat-associated protein
VKYDQLNQPVEVVGIERKTVYTYTSTGLKLKTVEYEKNVLLSTTEYSGAFVYENAQLKYINIPDGRYVVATGKYEYHLTDHLGNVHVTFTKNTSGNAEIIQEDHYYPFGLQMSGQHFENTTFLNKYLYNGKEKQTQTGYFDYGFRQLDPQLCRWHVADAMAESYLSTSPYAYVTNNPVSFKDYMGLKIERPWEEDNWSEQYYGYHSALGHAMGHAGGGGGSRYLDQVNSWDDIRSVNPYNLQESKIILPSACSLPLGTLPKKSGHWERVYICTTRPATPIEGMKEGEILLPEAETLLKSVWVDGNDGDPLKQLFYNIITGQIDWFSSEEAQKRGNYIPITDVDGNASYDKVALVCDISSVITSIKYLTLKKAGEMSSIGIREGSGLDKYLKTTKGLTTAIFIVSAGFTYVQVRNEEISALEGATEIVSDGIATLLGPVYGIAWTFGWEAGRVITKTRGYQNDMFNLWISVHESNLGKPDETNYLQWINLYNHYINYRN